MNYLVIIVIALIAIAIIYAAFHFNKRLQIRRKLQRFPASTIRRARSGDYVRIVGEVDFVSEPFISPVTQRECAFFHLEVEREQYRGRSTQWETLFEEKVKSPFMVRQRDYVAVVNVDEIEAYLYPDRGFTPGVVNKGDEELERYLATKNYDSKGNFGLRKSIRYKEGVLEKGEKVCVSGKAKWIENSDLLPDIEGKILYLTADENHPVYISDDPKLLKELDDEKSGGKRNSKRRSRKGDNAW